MPTINNSEQKIMSIHHTKSFTAIVTTGPSIVEIPSGQLRSHLEATDQHGERFSILSDPEDPIVLDRWKGENIRLGHSPTGRLKIVAYACSPLAERKAGLIAAKVVGSPRLINSATGTCSWLEASTLAGTVTIVSNALDIDILNRYHGEPIMLSQTEHGGFIIAEHTGNDRSQAVIDLPFEIKSGRKRAAASFNLPPAGGR